MKPKGGEQGAKVEVGDDIIEEGVGVEGHLEGNLGVPGVAGGMSLRGGG